MARDGRAAPRAPRTGGQRVLLTTCAVLVALVGAWLLISDDRQIGNADTRSAIPPVDPPKCSKRAATKELFRREKRGGSRERRYSGVDEVICRDLTGDGAKDMTFMARWPQGSGYAGWAIFRARPHGKWRREIDRLRQGIVGIRPVGRRIRSAEARSRKGDPDCCPSGGWRVKEHRWDGEQMVIAREYLDRHRRPQGFRFGTPNEPYGPGNDERAAFQALQAFGRATGADACRHMSEEGLDFMDGPRTCAAELSDPAEYTLVKGRVFNGLASLTVESAGERFVFELSRGARRWRIDYFRET